MKVLLEKLKGNFVRKDGLSVGLDIGRSVIKMTKLKFLKGQAKLSGFSVEPIQGEIGQILKKITQQQNIKKVNISVSGPAVIIRYATFARMSNKELRQALKFEAQKFIPFPLAEVNLDGCILKPDLPENKMLILVAAVKKEIAQQRLKLLKEAGLEPQLIDVDSLALINAFNFNYAGEEFLKTTTIALLNIGSSFSNLNILEDGIPRLSRDISIGGNSLPQELSSLAEEISSSFDYYESQSVSSVEKIFSTGEGSLLKGFNDMLGNALGITIEPWDTLRNIQLSRELDVERVKASAAQLAVVIGLALRR